MIPFQRERFQEVSGIAVHVAGIAVHVAGIGVQVRGIALELRWNSSNAKGSRCNCCGRSMRPPMGIRPTATASSACTISAGARAKNAACDSFTAPARSCSSTTAVRRCRSWTPPPASCARPRCSSPCSAPPHLCRGHLEPGAGAVDRLASARLRLLRRGGGVTGPR